MLTVPGLAGLVARELAGVPGVRVTGKGNDGRSDLVLCEVEEGRETDLLELRSVEDVFVEAGRTLRSEGDKPHWTAGRLWRPGPAGRALGRWQAWRSAARPESSGRRGARTRGRRETRPGEGVRRGTGRTMTYRVVARVLQERSYRRTELRRSLTAQVERARPGWRTADPASLEIWVLEYRPGRFVAGLRLSGAGLRQHGGRTVERSGALRPAVAAAMVAQAGPAAGTLLDPCCGSGTVLAEAHEVGWRTEGIDIDGDAVEAARRNVPAAMVRLGDARALDLPDHAAAACVSNLPFGRRYLTEGDPVRWLRAVLEEIGRVVAPGGPVILLVPELPRAALPAGLHLLGDHPLRLLGMPTTIWHLRRAA